MRYIGVFLFLFLSYSASAQRDVTLLQAVNIAIENSFALTQAELQVMSSREDYKQSRMAVLPNLNANAGSALGFGRSLDFTTYQFNNQTTQSNNFGLNSATTLFAGGSLKENRYLQSLLLDRSEINTKKVKDDIALAVANSFLQAITAREQIEVAKVQVKLRKTDLERTQKLIDAGVSAGSLAVDMEAQLANAQFQEQQAQNQYQLALLNLKQAMLLEYEEEINLIEPEVDFPSLDYLQQELNPAIVLVGALQTQGNVMLASQDIEIAQSNKKLAEAQRLPSLSFNAGMNSYHSDQAIDVVGTEVGAFQVPVQGLDIPNQNPFVSFPQVNQITDDNYTLFNQFGDNLSQSLSLNLSVPIFNRGTLKQQVAKADLDIQQAKVSQQMQEQQLAQDIQTAYLQAELAYRSWEVAEKQVESLEKSADFAKKRYDLGSASIYDYFTAQDNLANAELQLTQAKYDYLYKVKVLEFYKDNQFDYTK